MAKVLLVVPYRELQEKFEACVAQMDTHDMEIDICHLYGSRLSNMDVDVSKYHVVAARGITGHSIREKNPRAAFVEISVTSDDIINTMSKAVARFGHCRMAVVLPDSAICNMDAIQTLSQVELHVFRIHDEDDIPHALQEIRQLGVQCVVGGLTVCSQCENLSIPCVPIETAEETVLRTVRIAIETAHSIDRARTKSHLLRTLLDYHHDGVLACNIRGKIISCNAQACTQLTQGSGTVSELMQKHIDDVLPDSGWQEVMTNGVSLDTLRDFNGHITIMRSTPLMIDGQGAGVIFTIQNADMIRANDSKIQREVTQRGFTAHYTFNDIMVKNRQMEQRLISAYKYAQTDANILILGETGTGKEMFAQSIHNAGSRSGYPFVAVNCAALPEHLLESEMFGYSEGAFSGAKKGGKVGLFELAHKGTIFLDEIGEMPINLQAKLLRVLQEKNIRRIGDNKIIPVDVRIICATNISIQDMIAEGKFRSDLYYRINLLELRLPPLRERPEDIELIFSNLLERYSRVHHLPVPVVTDEAVAMMRRQPWIGNVRELRNFSERLVILNEGQAITPELLELAGLSRSDAPTSIPPFPSGEASSSRKRKEDIAREMGISRTTLWRRSRKQMDETP